jgi:hypothetical protein
VLQYQKLVNRILCVHVAYSLVVNNYVKNSRIVLCRFLAHIIRVIIHKVTLSSTCLWVSFHLLSPLSVVSANQGIFFKSQYEMLKPSVQCNKVRDSF